MKDNPLSAIKTDPDQKRFIAFAAILSVLVALIYVYDYYFMTIPEGVLYSDVKTQIGYVDEWYATGALPNLCRAYPLFYILLRAIFWVFRNWTATILFICFLMAFLSNMIQILFVRFLGCDERGWYSLFSGSLLSFVWPLSLKYSFFCGPDQMPPMYLEQIFLSSGATAPTHSLTFLAVKPFALVTVFLFIRMLREEDEHSFKILTLFFSASLLTSVTAKPNFYQAFAPAGVIVVLLYFIRHGLKRFMRCLSIAVAYLPATLWVIHSMKYDLSPYRFSLFEGMRWYGDTTPVPIVLVRPIVYCLFVMVCITVMRKWNDVLGLGALVYMFGTAEFLCLIEVEEPDFLSMGWGYYISQYVLFACCIVAFCEIMRMRPAKRNEKRILLTVNTCGNTLLVLHGLMGLIVYITTWLPWWKQY